MVGLAGLLSVLAGCTSVSVPMPQAKKGSSVVVGQRVTAGVGDPILAEYDYFYRAGAVPDASVEARSAEWTMRIPAGTPLMEVTLRDQKWYCTTFFAAYNLMGVPGANACLRDTKGDGHFDQADHTGASWGSAQTQPVTYRATEIAQPGGFKVELLYEGISGNVVNITYREFAENMIRPAFQQDLKYTLARPDEEISFRGVRIVVHSATNSRIDYTVLSGMRRQ
ncbi:MULTISPECIES: hypothetical protein [unclassified Azospirillum]|uniref:hypothetical protein n=1 Tax=unclassified Azospirillum TaxID=2630922 RepID=UPI0011B22E8E|nr:MULTISPECIES: hypothetical protein [unclassified Azospirillum]